MIASISKDITTQKKAEDQAREAASRRDQFLAMLSHELRNPLGAILNATRLLERTEETSDIAQQACGVITRQSQHMARLLDDLLDVARITQGKIHIREKVVDLRTLIQEAVNTVQPQIDECQHSLNVRICDQPVYVVGDPARLLQVQENLLSNAIKYTPPGGNIWLTLDVKGKEAVLSIQDNGVGIAPEMQETIFDLFVQIPAASGKSDNKDSGMGIGLTMVRKIAELHRGCISVCSDGAGKGSEFELRLPLTNLVESEDSARHQDNSSTGAVERDHEPGGINYSLNNAGLRVLIVEDNADSREMLESLLKLDGYDVSTAPDGVRGWEMIASWQPDVALVDVGLPGMDGYEVAKRVRAELPDHTIRLVALTGYGRSVDREAVFRAGFDDHLVKPVGETDLARVLCKRS